MVHTHTPTTVDIKHKSSIFNLTNQSNCEDKLLIRCNRVPLSSPHAKRHHREILIRIGYKWRAPVKDTFIQLFASRHSSPFVTVLLAEHKSTYFQLNHLSPFRLGHRRLKRQLIKIRMQLKIVKRQTDFDAEKTLDRFRVTCKAINHHYYTYNKHLWKRIGTTDEWYCHTKKMKWPPTRTFERVIDWDDDSSLTSKTIDY